MSNGANRPVTKHMADLVDKIVVTEPDMVREMIEEYGQNRDKIVCLGVPDIYERDEPELRWTLEQKLDEYMIREGLL
jgi:predicted protein tyrosine phosphatase